MYYFTPKAIDTDNQILTIKSYECFKKTLIFAGNKGLL